MTQQNLNLNETSRAILAKYRIENEKVFQILNGGKWKEENHEIHVENFLIGTNNIALEAAQKAAQVHN